jgi:hypothetical protein
MGVGETGSTDHPRNPSRPNAVRFRRTTLCFHHGTVVPAFAVGMWAITNCTPFAADSTWGRNKDGVHEWIVAVKATFLIGQDGLVRLADEQVPPLLAPEHHGAPGESSLRYDADLVAPKPTTDIVVNGTAYAPGGRPTKEFPLFMRVGEVQKALRAVGNRRWGATGLLVSSIEPITQLPIVYERAYGGYDRTDPAPGRHHLDSRNPVGRGAVARLEHRAGVSLPNFEYPNADLAKAGPAGFGALDCHWSPRQEWNGTYDEAWVRNRRPLFPQDWDPRSLQCAPLDQRPHSHLRGEELVELVNLSASGALRFHLPSIELVFRTHIDDRVVDHAGQLSTVVLEPDVPRVLMTWLTSILCRSDGDYLEETIIRQRSRR